jgi:hypothetical protein
MIGENGVGSVGWIDRMVKQRDRKGQAEAFGPSLRAKRSNPSRGPKKEMDCFVATLPCAFAFVAGDDD